MGRRGASLRVVSLSVEGGEGGWAGIRHLSSMKGFLQTPMWKVEGSSGKGSKAPGTCGFETSTVPLLWRQVLSGVMGEWAGWDSLHDVFTDVLYSFEVREEGMVMSVANWSVPWRCRGVAEELVWAVVVGDTAGTRRKAMSRSRSGRLGFAFVEAAGSPASSVDAGWSLAVVKPASKG